MLYRSVLALLAVVAVSVCAQQGVEVDNDGTHLVDVSALSGTWYVEPTGPGGPSLSLSFGRTSSADGVVYVMNRLADGTYAYNHGTRSWMKIGNLPFTTMIQTSDLAYVGGKLVACGASTSTTAQLDKIAVLDTVAATATTPATWTAYSVTNGPEIRDYHAITIFNGVMYMFGGFGPTPAKFYQGVWGFDLTQLYDPTSEMAWINVVAEGTAGLPNPRLGQTVNTYEDRMYMFGGFSHGGSSDAPVPSPCLQECAYYNDIWMWKPAAGPPKANTPGTWELQVPTTANKPAGRYGHLAVFLENSQLVVFGGTTEGTGGTGQALNDLWLFDEHPRAWIRLYPVGTGPTDLPYPLGGRVGRHLILFSRVPAADTFVYRYSPYDQYANMQGVVPSASPTPTPIDCIDNTDFKGLSAGFVLAILLAGAHLGWSVFTWWKSEH